MWVHYDIGECRFTSIAVVKLPQKCSLYKLHSILTFMPLPYTNVYVLATAAFEIFFKNKKTGKSEMTRNDRRKKIVKYKKKKKTRERVKNRSADAICMKNCDGEKKS